MASLTFASLPKELVSHIFEYDPTYHGYFKSKDFEKSIEGGFYRLENIRRKSKIRIHAFFTEWKRTKNYWENEYLVMDRGLWMFDERHQYEWQNDEDIFNIHWVPMKDCLGFKILPLDKKYESLDSTDRKIDGFVRMDEDCNIKLLVCIAEE